MNEVIKQLHERKSVRVFTEREIEEEKVTTILTAATEAPTAGNQQLYTILRITDESAKKTLAVTCDNQPFIADAKLILIFCADCLKWYEAFKKAGCEPRKPGAGDLMLAINDAVIAAQNAVVAAHSLGIGSCYIGDIMENIEAHRDLLALPEYVFPAAMLVFGYPTEQQLCREKPQRAPIEHIVHENTYRRMDARELQAMIGKGKDDEEYLRWIKAFCERKYNSDFSREMTRSVNAYLEQFGAR